MCVSIHIHVCLLKLTMTVRFRSVSILTFCVNLISEICLTAHCLPQHGTSCKLQALCLDQPGDVIQ